jgi:hypothetical protein
LYTANEGPVKILYKGLIPIYVFPEIKLLFPKHNYNVLSPSSYTHISVRDLYISRIGLPLLLQGNMWTNPGNTVYKSLTDTWMWKLGLGLRGRAIPRKGIHKWGFPCSVEGQGEGGGEGRVGKAREENGKGRGERRRGGKRGGGEAEGRCEGGEGEGGGGGWWGGGEAPLKSGKFWRNQQRAQLLMKKPREKNQYMDSTVLTFKS